MSWADLAVGQSATLTREVGDRDIERFAELTGDRNPAHVDEAWARRCRFGGRVAHGMLSAGYISAAIGTLLPGPGAIYLGQTLRFLKPVRPGDRITVRVEVLELIPEKRRVRLATRCLDRQGEPVIDGEALVLVDDVPLVP